jgi:hypothetical protein
MVLAATIFQLGGTRPVSSLSASERAARAFARNNPAFASCRRERRHWFPDDSATAVNLPKEEGRGWLVTQECVRCGTFRDQKWDLFGRRISNLIYRHPEGYREEFHVLAGDEDATAALNKIWIKSLTKGRSVATVHQLPVTKVAS